MALLTPVVTYSAVFPSVLWQLMAVSADRCHRRKCAESRATPRSGQKPGCSRVQFTPSKGRLRGTTQRAHVCFQQEACLTPVLRSRSSWGGGVHQGRRGDYSRRSPCAAGHQRPGPRWGRAGDGGPTVRAGFARQWGGGSQRARPAGGVGERRIVEYMRGLGLLVKFFSLTRMFEMPRLGYSDCVMQFELEN